MYTSKAVKSTALTMLKGKWANTCTAICICITAYFTIYLLSALFSIVIGQFYIVPSFLISVLTFFPLVLGTLRYFFAISQEKDTSVADIFYYFENTKRYLRCLSFSFCFSLKMALCFFITMIPAILFSLLCNGTLLGIFNISTPMFFVHLKYIYYVFVAAAVFLLVLNLIRHFVCAFIFVTNNEISPLEAIKVGKNAGECAKGIFSSHLVTFFGWIIISLFVLPLVFTGAYLMMSYVVECRFAVAYYNRLSEEKSAPPTIEV